MPREAPSTSSKASPACCPLPRRGAMGRPLHGQKVPNADHAERQLRPYRLWAPAARPRYTHYILDGSPRWVTSTRVAAVLVRGRSHRWLASAEAYRLYRQLPCARWRAPHDGGPHALLGADPRATRQVGNRAICYLQPMTKYHLVRAVGSNRTPYGHAIGHIDEHHERAKPWVAYLYQADDPGGQGNIVIEKKSGDVPISVEL